MNFNRVDIGKLIRNGSIAGLLGTVGAIAVAIGFIAFLAMLILAIDRIDEQRAVDSDGGVNGVESIQVAADLSSDQFDIESSKLPINRLPGRSFGQPFRLGHAEITPLSVEFRPVLIRQLAGEPKLSAESQIVLTFSLENVSEGALLSRFCRATAVDNFGNPCEQGLLDVVAENDGDDIRPGQRVTLSVAVPRAIETATLYNWDVAVSVLPGDADMQRWRIMTGGLK